MHTLSSLSRSVTALLQVPKARGGPSDGRAKCLEVYAHAIVKLLKRFEVRLDGLQCIVRNSSFSALCKNTAVA